MPSRLARVEGREKTEPEALILDESQIEIGDRVRTDPGDIESLAESIKLLGLLHPVVVRRLGPDQHKLVAGYRRILALRRLGRPIPVIVTTNIEDELTALQAERDENIERKEFTPDEALVMRDLIIEAEGLAEQAKQRQGAGAQHARIVRKSRDKTPGQTARSASPNVGEAKPPTARHSREKKRQAARATGYGATTLDKVEKVKTAAEDPALAAPKRRLVRIARDEMNATGNVSQALKTVQEVTGTPAPAPPDERDPLMAAMTQFSAVIKTMRSGSSTWRDYEQEMTARQFHLDADWFFHRSGLIKHQGPPLRMAAMPGLGREA